MALCGYKWVKNAYTKRSLHQAKLAPSEAYTKRSLHQAKLAPSEACTKRSLHQAMEIITSRLCQIQTLLSLDTVRYLTDLIWERNTIPRCGRNCRNGQIKKHH